MRRRDFLQGIAAAAAGIKVLTARRCSIRADNLVFSASLAKSR